MWRRIFPRLGDNFQWSYTLTGVSLAAWISLGALVYRDRSKKKSGEVLPDGTVPVTDDAAVKANFWQSQWDKKTTGWHLDKPHPALLRNIDQVVDLEEENAKKTVTSPQLTVAGKDLSVAALFVGVRRFFKRFRPREHESTVLVPLCGKTVDMRWLAEQKLQHVIGVELCEGPATEFYKEQGIRGGWRMYPGNLFRVMHGWLGDRGITIMIGNVLGLSSKDVGTVDWVWDRASLVALSPSLREDYAAVIQTVLKPHGKILMVVMQYDQSKTGGPPYSVSLEDVQQLYNRCDVQLLESYPGDASFVARRGLNKMDEMVLLLTKRT